MTTWRESGSRYLKNFGRLYSTFLVPYMVAAKGPARRSLSADMLKRLNEGYQNMPAYHHTDFKDLASFFCLGGLHNSTFLQGNPVQVVTPAHVGVQMLDSTGFRFPPE
jgi:hypothetical protein